MDSVGPGLTRWRITAHPHAMIFMFAGRSEFQKVNKINDHIRSEQKHCVRRRSRRAADTELEGARCPAGSEIELADTLIDILGRENNWNIFVPVCRPLPVILLKTDEILALLQTRAR